MGLGDLFPSSEELNVSALLFMMCVYGYILFKASCTISEGCEMLLLLYGPGIIGGLLIPILGAVPDCMVILLSGLGPIEQVANELSVGVGTLVGSTVMLITLPWCAGVILGRRDFDPVKGAAASTASGKAVCTKLSLTESCVTTVQGIPRSAHIMMLSSLSYLIIQLPAFSYHSDTDKGVLHERPYALTGLVVTLFAFVSYCIYQWLSAASEEAQKMKEAAYRREQWRSGLDQRFSREEVQEFVFHKFDKDHSGFMDEGELAAALQALGMAEVSRRDVATIVREIDIADAESGKKDGKISLLEFKTALKAWMSKECSGSAGVAGGAAPAAIARLASTVKRSPTSAAKLKAAGSSSNYGTINRAEMNTLLKPKSSSSSSNGDDDHEEEDEEEEEEEEYWELSEGQLKAKAVFLLALATVIVSIVSDPMVEVISTLGTKIDVSPFYISFIITPIASNASELISGILFARKKTTESISVTLSSLHGAATMNSTLGLCIFLCLVYFRGLAWSFTAEVLAVVLAILAVGANAAFSTNIFVWQAIAVGAIYPFTLLFVYVCENVYGLD